MPIAGSADSTDSTQVGVVYHSDFELQPYVPYHESGVRRYGCQYEIKRSDFLKLLEPGAAADQYLSDNVKSDIRFRDRQYFVDAAGIVRSGKEYFRIDKRIFERVLRHVEPCPRPDGTPRPALFSIASGPYVAYYRGEMVEVEIISNHSKPMLLELRLERHFDKSWRLDDGPSGTQATQILPGQRIKKSWPAPGEPGARVTDAIAYRVLIRALVREGDGTPTELGRARTPVFKVWGTETE